jgi:hypothetical protein
VMPGLAPRPDTAAMQPQQAAAPKVPALASQHPAKAVPAALLHVLPLIPVVGPPAHAPPHPPQQQLQPLAEAAPGLQEFVNNKACSKPHTKRARAETQEERQAKKDMAACWASCSTDYCRAGAGAPMAGSGNAPCWHAGGTRLCTRACAGAGRCGGGTAAQGAGVGGVREGRG